MAARGSPSRWIPNYSRMGVWTTVTIPLYLLLFLFGFRLGLRVGLAVALVHLGHRRVHRRPGRLGRIVLVGLQRPIANRLDTAAGQQQERRKQL